LFESLFSVLAVTNNPVVAYITVGELDIISDEYAEANAITVQTSGLIFEIQLGHFCNNRCNFCTSGDMTERGLAEKIPLDPILKAIHSGRAQGATKIIFLGGEPTLHDGFLDALAYALEIGFDQVVIFTNGARMARPKFMDACLELGDFEWRISIQGATEEVHDATTGLKGSFGRIRKGLGLLAERNQLITTNMCVCTSNYESVVHFPDLINRYNISQLHLDIVRPMSTPANNNEELSEIMPRHSLVAPYMRTMLEGFADSNPNFDINVGNIPFCLLPEWGSRMEHGGQETITQPTNGEGLEEQVNKYEWHKSARVKAPQCEGCAFGVRCTGVYREYAEIYGTDELTPLTFEELEAVDREQRSFPLLAERWFERLSHAAGSESGPEGWDVLRWDPDHRRRSVELRLSTQGGEALLVVLPRVDPPWTPDNAWVILNTGRYTLRLQAAEGISHDALGTLLLWLRDLLPEEDRAELDAPQFLRMHRYGERLRASVAQLTRSMKTFQPAPGWICRPPEYLEDEVGASLRYRREGSPDDVAEVTLRLYPVFDDERSRVGMSLDIPPATPPAEGRSVARRLVAKIKTSLSPA